MRELEADRKQIIHAPALLGSVCAIRDDFELGRKLVKNLAACTARRFGNLGVGDENELLESALATHHCAGDRATLRTHRHTVRGILDIAALVNRVAFPDQRAADVEL